MNLNEEQRRKVNRFILLKVGWTRISPDPDMMQYTAQCPDGKWGLVPDYTRSLDACHEALTWLSQNHMDAEQWEAFGHRVEEIHPTATLTTNSGVDYYDFANLLCSPSESIAVALFLTLGGEL